jgi:hypothetical protein
LHGYDNGNTLYAGQPLDNGHPRSGDASSNTNPGMLYARGSTVSSAQYRRKGTSNEMDPDQRRVNQNDINFLGLSNLKYNSNNQAIVGSTQRKKLVAPGTPPPASPQNRYR